MNNKRNKIKIAIGADHAGYELKEKIKKFLEEKNITYHDFGTYSKQRVDYNDYGEKVSLSVAKKKYTFGILICKTGVGMCIVANKVPNIRAVAAYNEKIAEYARRHNDCNIITIGAEVVNNNSIYDIIEKFIKTEAEQNRHKRRREKIRKLEEKIKKGVIKI